MIEITNYIHFISNLIIINMQNSLIRLSLLFNIIILTFVCINLIVYSKSQLVIDAWGESTPSRGIILSFYISILFLSAVLLYASIQDPISVSIKYMVISLLIIQIVYKLITILTVGITNPIVISNLLISTLHIVTLLFIWKDN
jgi:hypothetical protein